MKWNQIQKQIQTVLQDHQPTLEPEILDYLQSLLDGIEEVPDADERETLQSTFYEFLNEQECKYIHSLLSQTSSLETLEKPNHDSRQQNENSSSPKMRGGLEDSTTIPIISLRETTDLEDQTQQQQHKKSNKEDSKSAQHHKDSRKQRRETKQKAKKGVPPVSLPVVSELVDDHASAWNDRQEEGKLWGGRGHGGRGVRYTGENYDNIHLPSVSLQFEGNELLVDSPMDIVRGHRYGLLGRNGVGKSTLLRQLAAHAIPGMPHGMKILLVQQQVDGRDDQTALEALVEADSDRTTLLQEMETVEIEIEQGVNLEVNAQRLGDIVAELDAIDADNAENRAKEILKGLSFTETMIQSPTTNLSEFYCLFDSLPCPLETKGSVQLTSLVVVHRWWLANASSLSASLICSTL